MTTPGPAASAGIDPGSMDAAVLRIFARSGSLVGLGFLVTDRLALTCAHVVVAEPGPADAAPFPASTTVRVDLPLLGAGQGVSVGTTAVVEQWIPAQYSDPENISGVRDIAVLRLSAPLEGARPVRLVEAEEVWDDKARAYGLPDGRPGGVWHSGVLRHRQADGLVQVDLVGDGYPVSRGFSGGPVWDSKLSGVVGMMAMAESGQPAVSYLIPHDRVAEGLAGPA